MSSRRDDGFIIEFASEFQSLPWPAGVVASALFVGLSLLLPHLVSGPIALVFAVFGQWFLWLLAGATLLFTAAGVIKRALDRRRFDRTDEVRHLDPFEFERYVGEYFRRFGYDVHQLGGRQADGGADLVVSRASEVLVVQCKHWKAWKVGVRQLRELWGILDDHRATGAVLVTSGTFTAEAVAFSQGRKLRLIDDSELAVIVRQMKTSARSGEIAATAAVTPRAAPACPRCGSPMVLRTARRGQHTGERFWGCPSYPSCGGTLPFTPAT